MSVEDLEEENSLGDFLERDESDDSQVREEEETQDDTSVQANDCCKEDVISEVGIVGDEGGDEEKIEGVLQSNDTSNNTFDCPLENSYHTSEYGSCPIYNIDCGNLRVAIPYPKLYRYHGKGLKHLNRLEYCSLV